MSYSTAFDTLAYANKLKHGGFTEKQAEMLTEAQSESLKNLIDEKLATKHDIELVHKVKDIHNYNKKLTNARDPRTREMLERQIAATDAQIDKLVYELYGLTDDEIQIVEEAVG